MFKSLHKNTFDVAVS